MSKEYRNQRKGAPNTPIWVHQAKKEIITAMGYNPYNVYNYINNKQINK